MVRLTGRVSYTNYGLLYYTDRKVHSHRRVTPTVGSSVVEQSRERPEVVIRDTGFIPSTCYLRRISDLGKDVDVNPYV